MAFLIGYITGIFTTLLIHIYAMHTVKRKEKTHGSEIK